MSQSIHKEVNRSSSPFAPNIYVCVKKEKGLQMNEAGAGYIQVFNRALKWKTVFLLFFFGEER